MIFWKYQGLGNDFIVIEDFDFSAPKDLDAVRRLCDRHFGIGADGILYLEPDDRAVTFMRIMNSDGSEAEMCGNGIRCAAKHLYELGTTDEESMLINTAAGKKKVTCHVSDGEVHQVSVEMGAPRLECKEIPMNCSGRFLDGIIDVNGRKITGTAVSMGNPHFIIFEETSEEEIQSLAPLISNHPIFPKKTNVEFVGRTGDGLRIVVLERGVGWTLACGTGACASAVAAALKGLAPFGEDVAVHLPGGKLWVRVAKDLSSVRMTGPAERVFEGNIDW